LRGASKALLDLPVPLALPERKAKRVKKGIRAIKATPDETLSLRQPRRRNER
jgi:hypothetical protein